MEHTTVEVAIVGAGVSGLEAARVLHGAKIDVAILEARERIGGRIFTVRDPKIPVPIELGAEFVHGSAPELHDLAREANLSLVDIGGDRWQKQRGRFRRADDFWSLLDVVMRRLNADEPDRSFEHFLNSRFSRGRERRARNLALQWVEGYQAADPAKASARALAEGGSPGDDVRERRIGRLVSGYDQVAHWIGRDILDRVRFGAVVSRVVWSPGAVRIEARDASGNYTPAVEARSAIITLPLGVLQAPPTETGSVLFEPSLDLDRGKSAGLQGLEMGAVLRVALRCAEPFWMSKQFMRRAKTQELDRAAFFHTDDPEFPVWWTAYPVFAPLLVAWVGGPRARKLAAFADEQIVERAIAAAARQFGMTRRAAERVVEAGWVHNWVADPFARGAYSYVLVGGNDAPAKLARSLKRTLFFAGEASDPEGRTGTVHGAIATGRRAARQVLSALTRA